LSSVSVVTEERDESIVSAPSMLILVMSVWSFMNSTTCLYMGSPSTVPHCTDLR
jgi:hypothetical protein